MLIEKEDAKKAICNVCYMFKYIGDEYKECRYYPCDDIKALEAIPSAEAEQVTSKLKKHCDSLLKDDSADAKEQKSKLDLISRADAIDAVIAQRHRAELSDYNFALGLAEDAIRHLPSSEAVQGWIPCSERLPKPWENVMTTICWVGDEYEDDYDIAVGFKKISGDWDLTLADGTGVIKGFLVQAWMPLPTPYKGGGSK